MAITIIDMIPNDTQEIHKSYNELLNFKVELVNDKPRKDNTEVYKSKNNIGDTL